MSITKPLVDEVRAARAVLDQIGNSASPGASDAISEIASHAIWWIECLCAQALHTVVEQEQHS